MSSKWDRYGPAPAGTGDLSPLTSDLRIGLQVIGGLAVLSLALCSTLFFFITYRLVGGILRGRWSRKRLHDVSNDSLDGHTTSIAITSLKSPKPPSISQAPLSPMTPISPCLKESPITKTHNLHKRGSDDSLHVEIPNIRQRYKGYNPLLVLIYMLLIADIIQSASMIPNLVWVTRNAIEVRTETCWAQGWLRSQGDSECCRRIPTPENKGPLTPTSGKQHVRGRRVRQHMAYGGQTVHHSKQASMGYRWHYMVIQLSHCRSWCLGSG